MASSPAEESGITRSDAKTHTEHTTLPVSIMRQRRLHCCHFHLYLLASSSKKMPLSCIVSLGSILSLPPSALSCFCISFWLLIPLSLDLLASDILACICCNSTHCQAQAWCCLHDLAHRGSTSSTGKTVTVMHLQALPAEPDAGEADVVQVAVRLPSGTRFTRRSHSLHVIVFGSTAQLQAGSIAGCNASRCSARLCNITL